MLRDILYDVMYNIVICEGGCVHELFSVDLSNARVTGIPNCESSQQTKQINI